MRPDQSTWTPSPAEGEQPRQVRRILKLFRPYRGRLAIVGLLVGASSLVTVATPFLLKETLDVAIPQGRTGLLSLLALGMILSAVVTVLVDGAFAEELIRTADAPASEAEAAEAAAAA
ncbi:hypothetical protein ABZ474_37225, partial [Streptomyces mirabilis]